MKRNTIALALMSAAASALAQEASLSEMTVYGERPAAFRNITTSTEAATKALIESTNVINTEDAVKYLPSVQVRKRYIGDRNAILSSRNSGTIDSARSLVYADNVLVSMLLGNSFAYAPRWWFIAPQEIDRVDVSYGAHSAAYSGNAVGVVMVMKSKLPEKFEAHAEAQAFTQSFNLYGTDETYSGSRLGAFLGNRHGDLRWTLSASHFDNTGHPQSFKTSSRKTADTGGTVVTGYHWDKDPKNADRVVMGATSIDHTIQGNAKIKLAYDFSPASRLTYTLGHWRNDSDVGVQTYLRDASGNPVYSGSVKIDGATYSLSATDLQPSKRLEEHWMNSLTWRFDPKSEGDWAFEAALTDYDIDKDKTRKPTTALPGAASGGAGQVQLLDGTGWVTADMRVDWRPARGKRGHDVAFGYHYDKHTLNDRTWTNTNWLVGDATTVNAGNTGKTETQGIYVQDAIALSPDLKMTIGLRYEQWRAFNGTKTNTTSTLTYPDRKSTFASPKFSLSWVATEDWLLRGSLSRATRFPTVTELFQGSISGSTIVNNDPNLKPEKILAGELAAERDIGGGSLRVSLFQDNLKDALTRQTTGTVTTVQNVSKVRVRGIETALQHKDAFIRGLDLTGSLTFVDSRILAWEQRPTAVGHRMIRLPDWRATLAATWHASDKMDWTLAGRYSGRQFNEFDNSDTNDEVYGSTSRFLVIDAKFNYRFDKRFSVAVGVDNLTNEKYFAFHPYTQRSWVAQAKYQF
ncbi:MAG: TonB-dependent receptor [Candidatus Nitricoxidivorans perseverans]|uniref:TonB-dependent receptor n=1 Tax=Candidatus Nitricoxidivorans perseverans TaxID=2975601 RepID=A0AA49FJI8_9PROT|nr:MAG: TonB-dependent receptor [Candidatus Nitricoxidivorans perseverans]